MSQRIREQCLHLLFIRWLMFLYNSRSFIAEQIHIFFWCGNVLITLITMMTISIKAKLGKSEIINYRDASPIILDLVNLGIIISKIRWIGLSDHTKSCCQKAKNQHDFKLTYGLSGNLTIMEFLRFLNCALMLF